MVPLLLSLAFAAEELPSHQGAGVHWSPATDHALHYQLHSTLTLSEPVTLDSGQRLTTVSLDATLDCRVRDPSTARLWLSCDLSDVALSSSEPSRQATRALHGDLGPIGVHLEQSRLDLGLTRRGRLRQVDLDGNAVPDWVRPLVTRAVAGFDLLLPPRPGTHLWEQRQAPWLQELAAEGPLSRGSITHQRVASNGAVVTIESRGTVHRTFFDAALRPTDDHSVLVEGTARFDARYGALAERVWTVSGDPRDPYVQSAHLTLVDVTREADR